MFKKPNSKPFYDFITPNMDFCCPEAFPLKIALWAFFLLTFWGHSLFHGFSLSLYRGQRLINLEKLVFVRSLKSSNVEPGLYVLEWEAILELSHFL